VVRIRRAIEKVDEDMSKEENKHNKLEKAFERMSFETFLNLWK